MRAQQDSLRDNTMKYKKTIKRIAVALMIEMIMVLCAACSMRSENTVVTTVAEEAGKVELNQRQKDILEAGGLPTDYEILDGHQKSAIQIIELGLEYMENKYGKTFCYLGYVPSGVMDDMHLTCYEESLPGDEITVSISHEGQQLIFEDDYLIVKAAFPYEQAILDHLAQVTGSDNVFVIAEIAEIDEPFSDSDILRKSESLTRIVMDSGAVSSEQMKSVAEEFSKWMISDNSGGTGEFRFYLFEHEAFSELNRYNFDSIMEQYTIADKVTCVIDKNGEAKIR